MENSKDNRTPYRKKVEKTEAAIMKKFAACATESPGLSFTKLSECVAREMDMTPEGVRKAVKRIQSRAAASATSAAAL